MGSTSFTTRAQAEAAGYRRAKAGAFIEGYLCVSVDEPNEFGYDYALVPPTYTPGQAEREAVAFSTTVHLDNERNAGGSIGAYAPMFAPPLPGDCEHCRYDGERIERIGDADVLRWSDIEREAETVECLNDSLLGWDNYSHLYAVTPADGNRRHYLVRLSEGTDTVRDPLAAS